VLLACTLVCTLVCVHLRVYRSSSDGYCPSHQVDFIQASLVHMLETVYADLDINCHYAVEAEQVLYQT